MGMKKLIALVVLLPSVALAQFQIGDPLGIPAEVDPEIVRMHREGCLIEAFQKHRSCMANVCFALRDAMEPAECIRACDELLINRTHTCYTRYLDDVCE